MNLDSKNCTYYAVIFTSVLADDDPEYHKVSDMLLELAKEQSGFLGIESARSELGITVSYWKDLGSIKKWKHLMEHIAAQKLGKLKWYESYSVRICKVEREYAFKK